MTRLDTLARVGRALAGPTRSRILLQLMDGPAYSGAFADALGLNRANTSNHLACLRDCGASSSPSPRAAKELADPALRHALAHPTRVVLAVDPVVDCVADETPT